MSSMPSTSSWLISGVRRRSANGLVPLISGTWRWLDICRSGR
jgi:hypothetical protein